MLLHAGVAKVVTESARKGLQPHRPVQFEGSAATPGAQQAQALATSASGLWFAKTLHAPHYNDFFLLGVTPSAWIAGESGVGESCSQRVWTDKRLRLRSDKRGRVWS